MSNTEPMSVYELKQSAIRQDICNFIMKYKVEAYIKWHEEVAEINKQYNLKSNHT